MPARNFDVEPVIEQPLKPIDISLCLSQLTVRGEPSDRAFAPGGQGDESAAEFLQLLECNVRLLLDRAMEVRGGDQLREIVVACVILGQQNEPIDRRFTK